MAQLVHALRSPLRVLRATPLRVLTGVAIAMSAVAVYSTSLRLERLLFGFGLDEEQLKAGVALPAMAFDGHSTGTIAVSASDELANRTSSIVGSADSYAESLRTIVLPYYWSEFINAVLVLALCAVVLLLCIRLLRSGPFVASTTASLAVFAVVLGVGSIASQLVRRGPIGYQSPTVDAARERAVVAIVSTEHLQLGDYLVESSPYHPGGQPGLDLFPLGVAILVGLIAAAFWLGHRMQRDTEGLV